MTACVLPHVPAAIDDRAGPEPDGLLGQLAGIPPNHPSRPAVRRQAIEAWLPLAERLARRFYGRGVPPEDLRQVAIVGLIKAVDRFDPGRGFEFVAFAAPTILGEVRRYFRDHMWDMRVPRRLKELRLAVKASEGSISQELGHPPTTDELAADLDVPREEVVECLRAGPAYQALSLDAPGRGEMEGDLGEMLGGPDADLALVELRMTLGPALAALPQREQRILQMRFYGNLTQSEIAERVGVSQMHVCRLLSRSLARLREILTDDEPAG